MENIRTFHAVAMGESHKAKNIPCQDAAGSYEDSNSGIYIASISDGHGNSRHFMSEFGSKILIDITLKTIKKFITNDACKILSVEYAASEVLGGDDINVAQQQLNGRKNEEQNKIIVNLISSIISQWNEEIEKDWKQKTLSKVILEEKKVPDDAIDDYLNGVNIEQAYGCTLILFARTKEFWLAFQIGDGVCIAFLENAEVFYPIPADERFTGSKTASICNYDALDNFRYSYGNTQTPVAVFVGSDGLDGVFGTVDEVSLPLLENWYENVVKMFSKYGFENTINEIHRSLPILTAKGITKDDMSLSGIIDIDKLQTLNPFFLKKDIIKITNDIEIKEKECQEIISKIEDKKKDLKEKICENGSLSKKIEELKDHLNKTETEIFNLEQSKKTILNEIDEKQTQIKTIESIISNINESIKNSESSIKQIYDVKQKLKNQLDKLNFEYSNVNGSNDDTSITVEKNTEVLEEKLNEDLIPEN